MTTCPNLAGNRCQLVAGLEVSVSFCARCRAEWPSQQPPTRGWPTPTIRSVIEPAFGVFDTQAQIWDYLAAGELTPPVRCPPDQQMLALDLLDGVGCGCG